MQPPNRKELFRASKLLRDAMRRDVIAPGSRLRIARPLDAESLVGRHEGSRRARSFGNAQSLSAQLQKRIGSSRALARGLHGKRGGFSYDPRQRAVVKIHYFGHAGRGAAALSKHVKYIGRDAAVRGRALEQALTDEIEAHADAKRAKPTPNRERPELWTFYDATHDSLSGKGLADEWAREDRRHFRIILSPENGSRIGDMRDYVRDVMARAEAALGTRLQWFAVDHWDTDNPHTHIVLRGRREDGRDLILPREYVQHGFRNAARDAATARLGHRTRNDAREALRRETLAHRPTRLDALIADQLDRRGRVRIAELQAPNGSPDLSDALKARAHELKRLGLAQETSRNVLSFQAGWREALKAMEMHLDIRKSLMRARQLEAQRGPDHPVRSAPKGLKLPFGLGL